MFDKLLEFVVKSVRDEEQRKQEKIQEQLNYDITIPRPPSQFWASIEAWALVNPCKKKAAHHRIREQHWTERLAEAEIELREKGVTVDVFDPTTGSYLNYNYQPQTTGSPLNIASGAICNFSNSPSSAQQQTFQPRVDQKLMDNVKHAKSKMLDHRQKAENYEKLARAYNYNPNFMLRLSVDDVTFYGLGDDE